MKFQAYGKLNPDLTQEITPIEFAERAIFRRLDYLLGYLMNKDPALQRNFVEELTRTLQMLAKDARVDKESFDLSFIDKYPNLRGPMELVELHLSFYLQLLQISGQQAQENTTVVVPDRNYLRSYLVPRYHHALVLSEIMGKDRAVNLFKAFIDDYTISIRDLIEKVDDLEAVRARHIDDDQPTDGGWVSILSDVEDGRYVIRNDNCLWIEALDDLEDKELIYVICCHGDFIHAELMNDHFKFTRHFTIAEGHPYCDKVFHDTRIVTEVIHPSQEFFDNMWPLHEWQR